MAPQEFKRTASVVVVDQAREAAVAKVVCPICFEALSDYPDQVGALTFQGHRVETALYHSSCVVRSDTGKLVFQTETGSAVSPLTREPVDGFQLMPSLTKAKAWASFVNWEKGQLDVKKVTNAVCALLPVDECDARRFVLMEVGLSDDQPDDTEIKHKEVVDSLLPAVRRQLRRLVGEAPRRNAPELCRNSTEGELQQWFQFWDTKNSGFLDHATLHLAVVTAFHTALANSKDSANKAAVANAFFAEIGLRECEAVSMNDFVEKLAPQLLANLPVAYGRGWASGAPIDPKQPLTLKLREMRSGSERPIRFDVAGEVLVGDLRQATHRRFPVILARNEVKLFVMGQLLEDDTEALFAIRGIHDGATINFMPGKRRLESKEPSRCATVAKQNLRLSGKLNHNDLHLSDLEDLDTDAEDLDNLDEGLDNTNSSKLKNGHAGEATKSGNGRAFSRQTSPDSASSGAASANTWAEGDQWSRQLSKQSRNSVKSTPARSLRQQGSAPMQASSDPLMTKEGKDDKKKRGKSKETMPRVSKRCPLLLDNWSPDPEWTTPTNKEKAKVPKSAACQLLGA